MTEEQIKEQEYDYGELEMFNNFDSYQDFTDSTAIYPEDKALEYVALGLASEAGKFAGKVKKGIRDGAFDEEAAKAELGDVLWYVARAASELNVYLSDIVQHNVEKLTSRQQQGTLQGSGDNR